MKQMLTLYQAEQIAKDFMELHNPLYWDGYGRMPKTFSTKPEIYGIGDRMEVEISLKHNGGVPGHRCTCRDGETGHVIKEIQRGGTGSASELAVSLMESCGYPFIEEVVAEFMRQWKQQGSVRQNTMDCLLRFLEQVPIREERQGKR